MKMEQTESSETSAYKIQTPGNYPKENIQHTEHGESLKSKRLDMSPFCSRKTERRSTCRAVSVTKCIDLCNGHIRGGSPPHHLYHYLSLETKKQIQSQKHCGILPDAVDIVEKIYLIGRLLTLHEIRQQFHLLSTKLM